jgi:fructokinase
MAALHSTAFCLGGVALSSRQELCFRRGNVKASTFSCPPLVSIPRLSFQSKKFCFLEPEISLLYLEF